MYRPLTRLMACGLFVASSLMFCDSASSGPLDALNNIAGTVANVAGAAAIVSGAVPPGPLGEPDGGEYCFYPGGWHGAGYYLCGYAYRDGLGWGGPRGWRGGEHVRFRGAAGHRGHIGGGFRAAGLGHGGVHVAVHARHH